METRLNDNEVREVAKMQQKIDEYEMFIKSLSTMLKSKRIDLDYHLIHVGELRSLENYIWRKIKDNMDNIQ